MKAVEVAEIVLHAIPKSAAWDKMAHESYGAYNLNARANVKRVLYCVTPTVEVEDYFLNFKYDLLVSHHPYRTPLPQIIVHTALDCCEGGLNDQWRDALGLRNPQHFDKQLGWYGEIAPIAFDALCKKCERFMDRTIIGQRWSLLDTIRSVVICTGLGGSVTREARRTGADCYIMGEGSMLPEHTGFAAIIETGHTNSEWIGARLIRKLLEPHGITVDVAPDSIDRFHGEVYRAPQHVRQRILITG
jgi:putative NIF3 family GTP cyclohydrolase 1 type 2